MAPRDKDKKSRRKKEVKDSQLIIRMTRAERDAFIDLCETLDSSAAREIRRFIRDFVVGHTPKPDDSDKK